MDNSNKNNFKTWFRVFRSKCSITPISSDVIHIHEGVTFSRIDGEIFIEKEQEKFNEL